MRRPFKIPYRVVVVRQHSLRRLYALVMYGAKAVIEHGTASIGFGSKLHASYRGMKKTVLPTGTGNRNLKKRLISQVYQLVYFFRGSHTGCSLAHICALITRAIGLWYAQFFFYYFVIFQLFALHCIVISAVSINLASRLNLSATLFNSVVE